VDAQVKESAGGDTCSPGPEYMVGDWSEDSSEEAGLRERESHLHGLVYRLWDFRLDSSQTRTALHRAPITRHPQKIIDLGAGSGCWANEGL
jgi:hypothetical protein